MLRRLIAPVVLVGGLVTLAGPGLAEDASELTAEEIFQRFQGQIDDFGPTRSLAAPPAPTPGRGLTIAPSSAPVAETLATANPTEIEVVEVEYTPVSAENEVNIEIKFDLDSSFIRDDQKEKLATLCQVLNQMTDSRFRIVGHTDASGSAEYNDNLSVLRAEAVLFHLTGECGVSRDQLEAVGVGERYPANASDPSADENRRVEFQAVS